MTVFFVSRHKGAVDWASRNGIDGVELLHHFDPEIIEKGDVVIGTLPINLVAEVNSRGATYKHLTINLPPESRGKELSADDMELYGARLQTFYAASQDSATADVLVGEWERVNGEYGPERDYRIKANLSIEGAVLKLLGQKAEDRLVYIDRIPGAWRIHILVDEDDIGMQVSITDDGQVLCE